jgi:hypothetical protein
LLRHAGHRGTGTPNRRYPAHSLGPPFFSTKDCISTLISILITFVVVILVLYLVNLLPMDGRAKQIVRGIVIIIGILSLLRYLAVF